MSDGLIDGDVGTAAAVGAIAPAAVRFVACVEEIAEHLSEQLGNLVNLKNSSDRR